MNGLERDILRLLWAHGSQSRWELHQRTGRRPNSIGEAATELMESGLVRESRAMPLGKGRPRIPLEIDETRRNVVGLSIEPGHVEGVRLSLRGRPVSEAARRAGTAARAVLGRLVDAETVAIGVSVPGLVEDGRVLLSSAWPKRQQVDLGPLVRAAGAIPVTLDNDMHALAARWLLSTRGDRARDVLVVKLDDGAVGAAVLVNGRPNRGCVTGGNELGHTRFFVETRRCYCGQVGCLERICSREFLRRRGRAEVMRYVARGVANAANFIRPHQVILTGRWAMDFGDALVNAIERELLPTLRGRIGFERWDETATHGGENAGWLALARLFDPAWGT